MNILVTGSRGFIGSHLIPALIKKGHRVTSYDLLDTKDIFNESMVWSAIKTSDIIYHLAALTDVEQSISQWYRYYQTNVIGTLNVIKACLTLKKKLIYTSTAAIYTPLSSPYAHSKYVAESLISYLLYDSCILRLFNVYGEGMNKTTMLARFQTENPLTIYGDGKQTRDFIHIDDVIDIMISALSPQWNGFCGDIGTGKKHTVLSIAKKFHKSIQYREQRQEVYESKANIKLLRTLYTKSFKQLKDFI